MQRQEKQFEKDDKASSFFGIKKLVKKAS